MLLHALATPLQLDTVQGLSGVGVDDSSTYRSGSVAVSTSLLEIGSPGRDPRAANVPGSVGQCRSGANKINTRI